MEYCFVVPASRTSEGAGLTGFLHKVAQEVITLLVFIVFAVTFPNDKLAWTYLVACSFVAVTAFFTFAFKSSGAG